MLDQLRSAVNSWPAKILLGLVLLSFVAWGGHSAFQRESDDTLLTCGGASVGAGAYDMTLRNETLRLSMGIGRYLTPDEIRQFGINQAVFNRLYRNVLLDNTANALKLGISAKGAAALLARDPLFQNQSGGFDLNAFNFYVQTLRAGRDAFLNDFYAQAARRSQIESTVSGGADAPDTFYQAFALYAKQTREADYVELKPEALSQIPDANEAQLAAWFQANAERFRAPEYRQIDYLSLTAAELAKPDAVSEEAVSAYYNARPNAYTLSPERRSFMLARFPDSKTAENARAAMAAEMQNGVSAKDAFQAYFTKHNTLKPETETDKTQADFPGALGAAVFALRQGELSSVINDLQGAALVWLQDIKPAKRKPQAEVSAQIKQEIAHENALKALPDLRKKIEDSRYDGVNLREIAAQYHLSLRSLTLDKSGKTPQGETADFPQAESLLPNIFAAAENTDADPLNLQGGGYLWYNVRRIIPPHNSDLSAVRAQAMAAWKQAEQQLRLSSRAAALAEALNGGADFSALAKSKGLALQHAAALSREANDSTLGTETIAAIFTVMKGESSVSAAANAENRIVFRVNAVKEPQKPSRALLSAAEQQSVSQRMAADLLSLYIGAQAKETPVRVNKTVYAGLMQQEQSD